MITRNPGFDPEASPPEGIVLRHGRPAQPGEPRHHERFDSLEESLRTRDVHERRRDAVARTARTLCEEAAKHGSTITQTAAEARVQRAVSRGNHTRKD